MKYEITLTHDCVKFPLPAGVIEMVFKTTLQHNLEFEGIPATIHVINKQVILNGYENELATQLKVVQVVHELLEVIDEEMKEVLNEIDDRTFEEVVKALNGIEVQKHVTEDGGELYVIEVTVHGEKEIIAASSDLKNAVEIAETFEIAEG